MPSETAWLACRLTLEGPPDQLGAFALAAAGSAAIPWLLDPDEEEQRLLAPMAAIGADARVLAAELRDAVVAQAERAAGQRLGALYPLDLHRLLPLPLALLRAGPRDPASRAWRRRHWGTPQPLRHARRVETRAGRLVYDCYAAEAAPEPGMALLRRAWPELAITLRSSLLPA